jgi:hypothetical protein
MNKEYQMNNGLIPEVNCITSITPTLCKLMGISPPATAKGNALDGVIQAAQANLGHPYIEKCLIYCPDAIGTKLYRKYGYYFGPIMNRTTVVTPLLCVVPPKTPVCFASMFTGALPEIHGIKMYEKPVLKCDTIFDALVRAGKQTAIVAKEDSSIGRIFRERRIDYFFEKYDQEVTKRSINLLETNRHDFIVAYHQEYDDSLHATEPESKTSLSALQNHIRSFDLLAKECKEKWKASRYLIIFAPDHGAHIDSVTGKGTHGENIPDDMEVTHFFGFGGSKRKK